jgi:hypothetical protein
MPPTFLPFLAFMFYVFGSGVTLVIFLPVLFFKSKRLLAKKIIITVLISFPCLVNTGILIAIIFLLPALLFSWLANHNYISQTFGTPLLIAGLLFSFSLVAVCSLYIWYFLSKIIYKLLEKRPITEFLDNDKVFRFLQPYIGRSIIKFFKGNGIVKIAAILICIPVASILMVCIYEGFGNLAFAKPTKVELVGTYHISKGTVEGLDPSTYHQYRLEFKKDGTFELTSLQKVDVCSNGKYALDYDDRFNELTFYCGKSSTSAHIDRHLGFYRIEFIIGDPDSGESIYFEKDK